MGKQACCWWVSEFKKCVGLEISLWRLHSLYLLDCNLCLWKQTSNSSNFSQEVIMESLDWDKVPFPDNPSWFKDPSKHLITIEVLLKCDSSCNVEPSCTWILLQLIMWFKKKTSYCFRPHYIEASRSRCLLDEHGKFGEGESLWGGEENKRSWRTL